MTVPRATRRQRVLETDHLNCAGPTNRSNSELSSRLPILRPCSGPVRSQFVRVRDLCARPRTPHSGTVRGAPHSSPKRVWLTATVGSNPTATADPNPVFNKGSDVDACIDLTFAAAGGRLCNAVWSQSWSQFDRRRGRLLTTGGNAPEQTVSRSKACSFSEAARDAVNALTGQFIGRPCRLHSGDGGAVLAELAATSAWEVTSAGVVFEPASACS